MGAALRVFGRYLPPGGQETLAEGLLLEGRLRARIQVCGLKPGGTL